MKLIKTIDELKKGDTVIVKDSPELENLGLHKVTGDIFEIGPMEPMFTIKCRETNSIERVNIEKGKIFLIG